jgi:biotin synthase
MDVLLAENLGVDQVVFGPLVTHANTPLGKENDGDLELSLRILAAARVILKSVHIPAITAFEAISTGGRVKALRAGANTITVNLTPELLGRFWNVYPRNYSVNLPRKAKEIISRIGRTVGKNRGHSLNQHREPVSCSGNEQTCNIISRFVNKVRQDYSEIQKA